MNPEMERRKDPVTEDSDPLIDEVRRVRHEISAQFGHDPYKLVEYYMRLQEQHRDRLVGIPEPEETGTSTA